MSRHNRYIKSALRSAVLARHQYLHGRILDIGCGDKPYEAVLRPYVSEHIGLDHPDSLHGLAHADIVASAYEIPVGDRHFDSLLATEVLEHLEEPLAALTEWARVLAPGGCIVLTTPMIWHLHDEPRDFYRYTPHGVDYLLRRAGLEVVEVSTIGGFWSTFGQLSAYVFMTYDRGWVRRLGLARALAGISQRVGARIERSSHRRRWASHVVAVARRPEEPTT
jgi:SAM-dependent methyltransferase